MKITVYDETEPALPQPAFIRREGNMIRIGFSEGKGGLHAPGRIGGFTIHDAAGAPVPLIYRAEIDPSDPYCHLADERGFPVPVFGPIALPQEAAR